MSRDRRDEVTQSGGMIQCVTLYLKTPIRTGRSALSTLQMQRRAKGHGCAQAGVESSSLGAGASEDPTGPVGPVLTEALPALSISNPGLRVHHS